MWSCREPGAGRSTGPVLEPASCEPTPPEPPSRSEPWDRRTVNHRVRVLHAHPVATGMVLHDIHHRVIRIPLCPVALPLEHHLNPGHRLRSGLLDPSHRRQMSSFIQIAAEILNDIHFISVVNRLNGGKRDAHLCPKTSEHNLFAPCLLHRSHELLVIPGVHEAALNRHLIGINRLQLRPDVSTK